MKNKMLPWGIMAALCVSAEIKAAEVTEQVPPAYRPFSIGAEAGTTGFGGAARWRFADHFGVRAGANYFDYSRSAKDIEGVNYNAKIRLQSEPLTVDFYPWKDHSFYISLGALFNQNQLTGTSTGSIDLNGTTYNGTLNLKIDQKPVNPYLSIGGNLFYFDKAHRWSLAGELGAAYSGTPDVALTETGIADDGNLSANLAAERQKIQGYANDFKFWPVVKLSLDFSF